MAAAVLAGTWLGRCLGFAPPGLLVVLALLGLAAAAGRRRRRSGAAGLLLAVVAASALNGAVRSGGAGALPGPDRPVTATVRPVGHWRRLGDGWSAPIRVQRLAWRRRDVLRVVPGERLDLEPIYLRLSGAAAPPPLGSRLRAKGFLRRSPPLGNPPLRPPGPWRLQVSSRRLVAVVEAPGPVARLAGGLRSRVEETLSRAPPEAPAGGTARPQEPGPASAGRARPATPLGLPLARALLLGDPSQVPDRVLRGVRRLGLSHLLAVSGLHVGLVAGTVLVLGAPLPRRARLLLTAGAVGVYLLVVGPRPSLVRASVMAVLAVVALLAGRPPSAVNALGVAAAAIVWSRPAALGELGFQLSVGATAGLLLVGPLLAAAWSRRVGPSRPRVRPPARSRSRSRRWGRIGAGPTAWLRGSVAVSVGAQLGTLPWALPAFCLFTPAAAVLNVLAVPWAGGLLVAAGAWTLLALASPGAAGATLPLLDLAAAPFAWAAAVPASPWSSLALAPTRWAAAALAVALFTALLRPRAGVPLVLAGLVWAAAGPRDGSGPVEAVVLDVGQGDAVLLRDGGDTLLVDGGGWPAGDLGGRVLVPALARRGVRRLDAVLLTHADRDHCGGLLQLGSYLDLGLVLTGPGPPGSRCDRSLRSLPGVAHRTLVAGSSFHLGRWRLRVLHPDRMRGRGGRPGDNDASVVVAAEAFGRRLLLSGDAEAAAERALLARWTGPGRGGPGRPREAPLRAHVLKVAHHGSRTSSTERFLQAVRPRLALVSAGARNPYGHPAPEVLERLRRHGARALRTDRDGMIVLGFEPGGRWGIDLPGAPK